MNNHDRFRHDLEAAGYEVTQYRGRNFYDGPAVRVGKAEWQDVVRATTVRIQTDELGLGWMIYPESR